MNIIIECRGDLRIDQGGYCLHRTFYDTATWSEVNLEASRDANV